MNDSGLLAHLRDHFHVPPENLATEVLAYILNSSSQACAAWNALLKNVHPGLPELIAFNTQDVGGHDSGIPDLVGLTNGASKPFLAEVKFDAGLTSHQPVTYMKRLIETGRPGLLLFIVPHRRLSTVWSEVRRRCNGDNLDLSADWVHSSSIVTAEHGNTIRVGIVAWQHVLNELEGALRVEEDSQAYWDLHQLREMCAREDRQAFVPLTSQDLYCRAGQRLLDFGHLVDDVIEDVIADGTATRGRKSVSWGWSGTYFSLSGWYWYLGVSWENWASRRPTPMWLVLTDDRSKAYTPLSDALDELRTYDPPKLLRDDLGRPLVPNYLPEGVDRDQVRSEMREQVQLVASLLWECPPPDSSDETRETGPISHEVAQV